MRPGDSLSADRACASARPSRAWNARTGSSRASTLLAPARSLRLPVAQQAPRRYAPGLQRCRATRRSAGVAQAFHSSVARSRSASGLTERSRSSRSARSSRVPLASGERAAFAQPHLPRVRPGDSLSAIAPCDSTSASSSLAALNHLDLRAASCSSAACCSYPPGRGQASRSRPAQVAPRGPTRFPRAASATTSATPTGEPAGGGARATSSSWA